MEYTMEQILKCYPKIEGCGQDYERNIKVCKLRTGGATFKEVGIALNISASRAGQIYYKAVRYAKRVYK